MTEQLLHERRGRAGLVTLNRPHAHNALTLEMFEGLAAILTDWRRDNGITHVILRGAGERAFCAGGDVRLVREAVLAGTRLPDLLFRAEYSLNHMIRTFPKPIIAVMNGLVMGGGFGLSGHASHRLVTERTRWAMPEVKIGFFPDVGATYVLPRLKNGAGWYLGLAGATLAWRDCMALGLGSHAVPFAGLGEVIEALTADGFTPDHLDSVLQSFAAKADGESSLPATWRKPQNLAQALEQLGDEITEAAPLSLAVTFEALKRGESLSFADCLRMEFRLSQAMITRPDFAEGVRARLVDKDQRPAWTPDCLENLDPALVSSLFQTPKGGDLNLS